jgi:hypothetical protein
MGVQTLTLTLNRSNDADPTTAKAEINDSVRIPDATPLTCLMILPSVQRDPSLVTNFNIPAILENLANFKEALTAPAVLPGTATLESAASITTYLTSLRDTDYPKLQQVANCVVEGTIGTDPLQLQAQQQVTEESKSRLAAITAPETHVSYYESWFPRPMKEDAIFALFGVALFLLLVSVTFFLGMSGIEFQIIAPNWVLPVIDYTILTSRTPVLLTGLGVGLILAMVGRYLKWF